MPTFRNTVCSIFIGGYIYFIPTCPGRWNRQCSETIAYKILTPGNYPEESTQHSEHGKGLKSRRQKLDLISANPEMCITKTAHTDNFKEHSRASTPHTTPCPYNLHKCNSFSQKNFFVSDFLENALVILHFYPPFSIAKKYGILYGKQGIS